MPKFLSFFCIVAVFLIFLVAPVFGSPGPVPVKTYFTPVGFIPVHVKPTGIAFAMPVGWRQIEAGYSASICGQSMEIPSYLISNHNNAWIWIDLIKMDTVHIPDCLSQQTSIDLCLPLDAMVQSKGATTRRYFQSNLRLPNACEWFPQLGDSVYKAERRAITVAGSPFTQVSGYVASKSDSDLNRVFVANAAGKIGGRYVSIGFVANLPIDPINVQAYEHILDSFCLSDLTNLQQTSSSQRKGMSTDENRLKQLVDEQTAMEGEYLRQHRAYLKEVYSSRRQLNREAELYGSSTIEIGGELQALRILQKNVRILEAHTLMLIDFIKAHTIENKLVKMQAMEAISSGLLTVNTEDEGPQGKSIQDRNHQLDLAFQYYLKSRDVFSISPHAHHVFKNIPLALLGEWVVLDTNDIGRGNKQGFLRFALGSEIHVIYPNERAYYTMSLIERDGSTFTFKEIVPRKNVLAFPPKYAATDRVRISMSAPRQTDRPNLFRLQLGDDGTGSFTRLASRSEIVLAQGILAQIPADLNVSSQPRSIYPKSASLQARLPSASEVDEVLKLAGIATEDLSAARPMDKIGGSPSSKKEISDSLPSVEDFGNLDRSAADAILQSGELSIVLGETPRPYHWWACNAGYAAGNYKLFAKWWQYQYKYAKSRGYKGPRSRPNKELWKQFRIVAHFRPDALLWLDERIKLGIANQKRVANPGKIGRTYSIPHAFAALAKDPFRP